MNSRYLRTILFALMLGGGTIAEGAIVYNAAADFSATSNPNGVWSYGESATLGSPFHLYTQSGPDNVDPPPANLLDTWNSGAGGIYAVPAVLHNGTASPVFGFQPGELGFHPGPLGEYSIVRLTAAVSGDYELASAFRPIDGFFATTDVHVLLNGISIFDDFVNGTSTSFDANLTLAAGDVVDFAVGVGSNGNYYGDATGLSATLTTAEVPEPSTLALLGIGLAGLICTCRAQGNSTGSKTGSV